MLVQIPAGDPFQYEYQLSVDGDGDDDVQVWKHDAADDLTFSPIFTDDADTLCRRERPREPSGGNACARTTMALLTSRKGLVFP